MALNYNNFFNFACLWVLACWLIKTVPRWAWRQAQIGCRFISGIFHPVGKCTYWDTGGQGFMGAGPAIHTHLCYTMSLVSHWPKQAMRKPTIHWQMKPDESLQSHMTEDPYVGRGEKVGTAAQCNKGCRFPSCVSQWRYVLMCFVAGGIQIKVDFSSFLTYRWDMWSKSRAQALGAMLSKYRI